MSTFGGSAETETLRTSVRIRFHQPKSHWMALIAFHSLHQPFTRALPSVIACNRLTAVRRNRTIAIAIAPVACWISEISGRTLVTASARESLTTHTLSAVQIARLSNRSAVIAIAYLTSFLVLPAPRVRIALLAIDTFAQRRTYASARFGVAIIGRIRASITFWNEKRVD